MESCSWIDDLRVVCVRQRLYDLVPVGEIFCNIMPETRQDRSVEVLDSAVGLRVICSRDQMFNAQMDSNCAKEQFSVSICRKVSCQFQNFSLG